MRKLYQYPKLMQPVAIVGQEKEALHPDAYQAPTNNTIPQWAKHTLVRGAFIAAIPTLFFTNIFPPNPNNPVGDGAVLHSNQSVVISVPKTTQYKSYMYTDRDMASEAITIDKWKGYTLDYIPDKKRLQYSYPSLSQDPTQLTRPEVTTPDRYAPRTEAPLFDKKKQQWTYPHLFMDPQILTQAEATSVDRWMPPINQPRFDIKRQQYTYPYSFPTPEPVIPFGALHVRSVIPQFDIKRLQYMYPYFFMDNRQLAQAETTSPDRYMPRTNVPLFDIKRQQWIYPSLFIDPQLMTRGEDIKFAAIFKDQNKPVFDIKRNQYTYPSLFFDPRPIGTPMYVPSMNSVMITFTRRMLYQRLSQPVYPVFTAPEEVTADKWFRATEQPRFDIKRNQHLYPTFMPDPYVLTQAERPSIDKWGQPINQPRFDIKRQQWTYRSFFMDPYPIPIPPETITMDKWFMPTQQPRFDIKRQQMIWPSLFFEPRPFGTVMYVPSSNNVMVVYTRRVLYQTWARPVVWPIPEAISMDKWFRPTQQPRFDLARRQWLYPNFFAVYVIVNPDDTTARTVWPSKVPGPAVWIPKDPQEAIFTTRAAGQSVFVAKTPGQALFTKKTVGEATWVSPDPSDPTERSDAS